jgi:acetyl-CoA C-acetyltransferase
MAITGKEVVMVSGCRTAIGKYGGTLKDIPLNDLTCTVAEEAIKRAGIDKDIIDEIVSGFIFLHGNGSLPPRIVSRKIGLSDRVGGTVVNQNCASSMRATDIATMKLRLGESEVALVTGSENMSRVPYIVPTGRWGARMGDTKMIDPMLFDGLYCSTAQGHMGVTAENVAEKYGITREECDELALISHRRAVRANDEGRFKREIVPYVVKTKKGETIFDRDEHPIQNASVETMAKLPTAFKKGGVVTAANASGLNDAAVAAIFMTKEKALDLGLKPLLKLLAICSEGVPAEIMGVGPAVAIPKALKQAGMKFEDIDYWEINEAFAPQFLGVGRMLKEEQGIDLDWGTLEKDGNINNNGSGIGLGHPVGCTGLRLIVSLYYELERLGKTTGGASLCVGGGPAMASLWTRDI